MVHHVEAESADLGMNGGAGRIPSCCCTLACAVYKHAEIGEGRRCQPKAASATTREWTLRTLRASQARPLERTRPATSLRHPQGVPAGGAGAYHSVHSYLHLLLRFEAWGRCAMLWHDGWCIRHTRFRYWLLDTMLRVMTPAMQRASFPARTRRPHTTPWNR